MNNEFAVTVSANNEGKGVDTMYHYVFWNYVCLGRMIAEQIPTVVVVKNFHKSCTLYCLSSSHGRCKYEWKMFGYPSKVFPSTPVVYVKQQGLYMCTVLHKDYSEPSKVIEVKLDVGKFTVL